MSGSPSPNTPRLPHAQVVAQKVFSALERFLHIEAVSGVVLLFAAAAALVWANSPAAHSYHEVWQTPLSVSFGQFAFSQPLHFWINDVLMTVFFLVVGMEIRREIHEGALSNVKLATLPLAAAMGGVLAPAVIYIAMNAEPVLRDGWAVPTATDIAFAVGVLALLGRSIPGSVRVLLLALAIIDDIVAVLIIALFYSGGLDLSGLIIAAAGVLLVLAFQQIGLRSAYAYVIPGAVLWFGLYETGAHPSLAGVALGMLTPVASMLRRDRPMDAARRALSDFGLRAQRERGDPRELLEPLKQLKEAQRDLLPPVTRVQMTLHPWVAFGVMPLFALANAGVELGGVDFAAEGASSVVIAVTLALLLGKPLGITLGSWIAVRAGWCRMPADLTWPGVLLVGALGGIGFTMSIFIANLAFADQQLLAAAKSGVLLGSLLAGIVGLIYGRSYVLSRQRRGALQTASARAAEEEMSVQSER